MTTTTHRFRRSVAALASAILLAVSSTVAAGTSWAGELPVGDPARCAEIYYRCQGCHSIDQNWVGPKHRGLFGRKAGSVPGFSYSAAMRDSGIVWDERTLDAFLANPCAAVPETKMTYAGAKDPQERPISSPI